MFYGLTYDPSWRMFHVHLRKICILLPVDKMFCVYLLIPSNLLFKSSMSVLIFCLGDLSIVGSGLSKSTTIIVFLPTSHFKMLIFALYIFRCSSVECISFNLLHPLDWLLYHDIMSLVIVLYRPNVYIVWYKYSYPCSPYNPNYLSA